MPEPEESRDLAISPGPAGYGLPKLCGGDVELGNSILGLDRGYGSGPEAARVLLREIAGAQPARQYQASFGWPASGSCPQCEEDYVSGNGCCHGGTSYYSYDPQDWGRKFLPANGGCIYIDLNHLELCLPEVLSAYDHVAAWHAMLRIAREAQVRASARLPEGRTIQVLINNSDGLGNSYGSHMDFLITRRSFDNIFHRKLHHLLFFASYLTSSIVFSGAGKVGSENSQPGVHYQLAQRADFYETLTGIQTTYRRPIVNSRDESLCGSSWGSLRKDGSHRDMARLHVIFFDNTLCHVSSLLKVGVTQILLSMIEQECIAPRLILDDPLDAVHRWSHDPSLSARARLMSGGRYTAVELQQALLEEAGRFVAGGRAEGLVPRAQDIMTCWAETLELLREGDVRALASRLDWALKLCVLQRAISQRGLQWASPEVKHLDHIYSSLDPSEGLYWAYERSGLVEKVVSDGEIERFVHEPPEHTRAWLRAHILRRADPATVDSVDWDAIRFKFRETGRRFWPSYSYRRLAMQDPLGSTRERCRTVLEAAGCFEEVLESLGAERTDYSGRPLTEDQGDLALAPLAVPSALPPGATGEADEATDIRDVGTGRRENPSPDYWEAGENYATS